MNKKPLTLFPIFLSLLFINGFAQNRTHFRGTNLNDKALDQNLPISWSPDSNIVWKTEIPGSEFF